MEFAAGQPHSAGALPARPHGPTSALPHQQIAGGIADEIIRGLATSGGGTGFMKYVMPRPPTTRYDVHTFPFDPEVLKFVLDDLLREAGVRLLLHASAVAPLQEGPDASVEGVLVETRGGRRAIRAVW